MTKVPGKLPHFLGILGFVLSLASIGWQVYTYRESLTERAIVRLSALHITPNGEESEAATKTKGDLWIEVVNTGQRPIYVRAIFVGPCNEVGGRLFYFYGADKLPETPVQLEPGASHTFQGTWDFGAYPLTHEPPDYCVKVATTKGQILNEPAHISTRMFGRLENKQKKD